MHRCTATRRSAGSVSDPTGGPSQARGTPPLSPHALVSSFAHALVRDAPCALADAARADKLGEEARAASEGTPLALVNCASGPQPRSRAGSAAAGVKPESSFDDFQAGRAAPAAPPLAAPRGLDIDSVERV